MIEVKARVMRGAVYFAGEAVQCEIVFTHIPNENTKGTAFARTVNHVKEIHKDRICKVERLAWASVQIHCQCNVNSSSVAIPGKSDRTHHVTQDITDSSTSFTPSRGEQGYCLLSTPPKILFCDLKLAPGESKTFLYNETIPRDGPPSFKGQAVKYSYKVTLGTSRVQSQIKLLRLPLRILVVQGLGEIEHFIGMKENPSNPFLEHDTKKTPLLDVGVDFLNAITSRRNSLPNMTYSSFSTLDFGTEVSSGIGLPYDVYNIISERGSVGKFCLFKSAYRIGEEIVGSFDFSESLIPCLKCTVTLQSGEHIPEDCRPPNGKSSAVTYTSYCSVQESCLHTKKTHIVLPVSITACPEFVSDFAGASPLQSTFPQLDTAMWQGPSGIETEIMTWDLPIKLLATNPVQASSVSMSRTSNSIFI